MKHLLVPPQADLGNTMRMGGVAMESDGAATEKLSCSGKSQFINPKIAQNETQLQAAINEEDYELDDQLGQVCLEAHK
jgi:hypothetical protein